MDDIETDKLSDLFDQVLYLRDLFQRKLLEDKSKNRLIQVVENDLHNRYMLDKGECFASLFQELLLAIDRLRSNDFSESLIGSFIDEFFTILARYGVTQIPDSKIYDPQFHEIISILESSQNQTVWKIAEVVRDGFMLGDRVLRPTQVIVVGDSEYGYKV